MVGVKILQYQIIEQIGQGGMFQISPRTLLVSGKKFENPPKRSVGGGVA